MYYKWRGSPYPHPAFLCGRGRGFSLVVRGEDIGENGAGDAVPGTGNGARNDCHWVRGNEESHCEIGAKTGILHADLDAQRAFLCG